MTCYSLQPRDRIFDISNLLPKMFENIGKHIGKNLRGIYSWKLLDHVKQSAADAFRTSSKRVIQNSAEVSKKKKKKKTLKKFIIK